MRQYDPGPGFISVDPLWESFPAHSPYVYAFLNPVAYKDPSGLSGVPMTMANAPVDGGPEWEQPANKPPVPRKKETKKSEEPSKLQPPVAPPLVPLVPVATGTGVGGIGIGGSIGVVANGIAGGVGDAAREMAKGIADGASEVVKEASASAFTPLEAKSLQSRSKIKNLTKDMKANGWNGDPIEVFEHQGSRYILEGHHRVAAARAAKIQIPYVSIPFKAQNKYGSVDAIIRAATEAGGR